MMENHNESPDLPGELREPDLFEALDAALGVKPQVLMHEGEEIGLVYILGGDDDSSGHNDELNVDEQKLASDLHQIGVDAVKKKREQEGEQH